MSRYITRRVGTQFISLELTELVRSNVTYKKRLLHLAKTTMTLTASPNEKARGLSFFEATCAVDVG